MQGTLNKTPGSYLITLNWIKRRFFGIETIQSRRMPEVYFMNNNL